MTQEELKQYDGRDGRKAYVAVSGKIYDVTDSPLWSGGDHQSAHQAGGDLTEELKTAPHVRAVIERFSVVGELRMPVAAATGGAGSGKPWIVGILLLALVLFIMLIF